MSPRIPYPVCVLALSHERAGSTAAWTGALTALAAGLALSPLEWATLAGLTVVCGVSVRTLTGHLLHTWLDARPDVRSGLREPFDPSSDYDASVRDALTALASSPPAP